MTGVDLFANTQLFEPVLSMNLAKKKESQTQSCCNKCHFNNQNVSQIQWGVCLISGGHAASQ